MAASPSGAQVYVVFIASEAPTGIPKRTSARPETDAWQVLYRFDLTSNALVSPKPIAAFQVRSIGHTGGGLACLPDGSVLLAIGDNGDASQDGLNYPDDPSSHLGKILRIDPGTGASTVVARGVRNPQRLVVYGTGAETRLDFIPGPAGLSSLHASCLLLFVWLCVGPAGGGDSISSISGDGSRKN